MIRLLLPIAQRFRRFYWWLVRPTTRGVRAIIVNESNEILLVRHTYQEGWFLPGGKTDKNEDDEVSLTRELREELGIQDISISQKLGEYESTYEYKKDHIVVFVIDQFTQRDKKHFELKEYGFFHPEMLPEEISPGTRKRIEEWLGKRTINNQW